jgi:hypothetical protein
LLLRNDQGNWLFLKRWQEQLTALARIQSDPGLSFEDWQRKAERALASNPVSQSTAAAVIFTTVTPGSAQRTWPTWPGALIACLDPEQNRLVGSPRVIGVNGLLEGFQEVTFGG